MRTRHALILSLASAVLTVTPSLARAQRTVTRECFDRYSFDARRYADCRYDIDRSRALQREAIRERSAQRRERTQWDAIVRQAMTQARAYDLAERSRQRAAESVIRARAIREEREDRVRERTETMLRERLYRIRR
ncbi:MAG TPA: hypothetical protein VGP95_05805 [Gemmatimonadaceae bacterium]|nr:hypothetical protein [Gemmatimonadaceae bacterium]